VSGSFSRAGPRPYHVRVPLTDDDARDDAPSTDRARPAPGDDDRTPTPSGDDERAPVASGDDDEHAAEPSGTPAPRPARSGDDESANPWAPISAGPRSSDAQPGLRPDGQPAAQVDGHSTVAVLETAPAEPDEPAAPPTRDELLDRLVGRARLLLDATRRDKLTGWAWALAVTLLAGVLRFWDLGKPHSLVFDETYYVKDGWSLTERGYEADWGEDPNPSFEAGDDSSLGTNPVYVVHPQVGKWLIGLGMRLTGGVESAFGWRFATALLGTLSVLLVARIARRMFGSTAWGTIAGLLLAVDGVAIVLSRTALLDPILMFFVLAAFGALLLDREQSRRRLAERTADLLAQGRDLGWGPALGFRWWRLAAGVLLGLGLGTKWSALYFLAVFGLLTVAWDATARRTVGVRNWAGAAVVKDGLVAAVVMVGSAFAVYLASWWSWFTHAQAWGRNWAAEHPGEGLQLLPDSMRSFVDYHRQMWIFHNGLETEHTYSSNALGWIVQWRPTSFYWDAELAGLSGADAQAACGAEHCARAVLAIGNPVLWWSAAAAILVALFWLVRYRDWRAGAVLSGLLAGWVPWLFSDRTIFGFYSIAFTPWVVLTLVYVLTLIVGPPTLPREARRGAIIGVGVFLGILVAVSVYFYPLWAGWTVPYDFWHQHMWLKTWV
jgi:dolichyl-phosphate-mannose-protein mannosyltransferase